MAHILMICHDQHLDRRVTAQAHSLIKIGHKVTLIALSFSPNHETTVTSEGIQLHRIGLNAIVPNNFIYIAYIKRQQRFLNILNKLRNASGNALRYPLRVGFRVASRMKWLACRLLLLVRYRSIRMPYSLPFTQHRNKALNALRNSANAIQHLWSVGLRAASGMIWFPYRLLATALQYLWSAGINAASRMHLFAYRLLLFARYRNTRIGDPLPFTSAFLNAAERFRVDAVQVHDLPGLEAGAILATRWQVPLVYDAHELYPEQCSFSPVQKRLCSAAEAKQIHKAVLVFAVNESIAVEMSKRYRIPKPTPLLNAVDPPPDFDPDADYDLIRQKLGLPRSRRMVLFQGGFSPHRNLGNLILAMSRVQSPDVALILMGFGNFGEKLKALAQKKRLLDKRVYFLPAVPQSELLQHSASADIGIIPYPHADLNSYYCTPNKLFEFIQAGLPILANESPELDRFVGEQGFGLIRPLHTAEQIARAVDAVFAGNEIGNWKQNLRNKRDGFSWERQESIYLAAMQSLIGETTT
uniref:Glycosyltransferase involved in cell wall bisynthesis n=1 Tax=Candidatus Kentrum sp. SD TaxID=2126332 RepID=A0A450YSP9_9GAMM|nr:MAG: Glycosyltransferase involved in cell wall bisynthesis [Candidatus Kentron sp. SD]VFK44532.1 MAG: Glycosyltransferase involved in cell wall bisynthesis [Candidatus Kentron sp. SD]